ncbi:MAG TPA: dihydropteroate synthase [Saprospiraceae bacterium]|nr:dihydropteroate synthase [Saprospiraceae bacterium]
MLRENAQVTLRFGDALMDISSPIVMGILNVTPDSFYAASRVSASTSDIVDIAAGMLAEGASILDVGGMSTRPGAVEITIGEELDRVLPVIELIHSAFPEAIISLDTYRSEVARQGLVAGARMINDISGGGFDPEIINVVKEHQVPYVLMHTRSRPVDMQQHVDYSDFIGELIQYFVEKLSRLNAMEIADIIIDPGFGFAKTMRQNYEMVDKLNVFRFLGHPVMIGLSRKSTLAHTIGKPTEETLYATSALHLAALQRGASILRVHDVGPAMDVIRVYQQMNQIQNP